MDHTGDGRDVLAGVAPALASAPFRVQLAVDRQWERAWKLPPDRLRRPDGEIRDFLREGSSVVGIEAFYKTGRGMDLYFGVQFHPALTRCRDPFAFVSAYLETLSAKRNRPLPRLVRALGAALNDDPATFVFGEPDVVLLGVVDWWLTFGPCEIWKRGDPRALSAQTLQERLRGRDDLSWNPRNYTGLEFVYQVVPKYWINFQVAREEGGGFALDRRLVRDILSTHLGFART